MAKRLIRAILWALLLLVWLWSADRGLEGTARFHEEREQQHIERCEQLKNLYRLEHN